MNVKRDFKAFKEGALAFIGVGVGVSTLLMFISLNLIRTELSLIEIVGVVFYRVHNPLALFGVVGLNLLSFNLTNLFAIIAVLVAPVVLVLQGRELVGDNPSENDSLSPTKQGALLVVGYAPLALVGAVFLFDVISIADIVFTAVFYPLVFGAIGGASTGL